MEPMKKLRDILEKYKYPLIVLVFGVLLLLLPIGSGESSPQNPDARFERLLCNTTGVGRAQVIISDKGVVVACEGADSAKVRLDILRSVASYTGYRSEKVTILKLK